jgi:cytochrome c biogenesis protein CcmG/thiol:disulfide interchange protein DsbE
VTTETKDAVATPAAAPADTGANKRLVGVGIALSVMALMVYVMARGFGTDPHSVPFLLSGKAAPPFTMKRLDTGQNVSLEQFKGRPIVMHYWATWCGPCKYEIPVLDAVARQYGDKVVFIGVVFEDTEPNAQRFVRDLNWSFLQLFDPKSTIAVDYGVSGVPETYFINKQGIIVTKSISPFENPRELSTMINSTILKD